MTLPREQRSVAVPAMQPQDVSRGLREAGASVAQSGAGLQRALAPMSELFLNEGKQMAEAQGQEQAASVPLERDEEGRLRPPDLSRSAFTTAGQEAYRAVLSNRYANEFVLDNQKALLDMRAQHANNPDAFMQAATSHRDGLLSTLPAQLRVPVGDAFGRQAAQHYNNLFEQRFARDRAEAGTRAGEVAIGVGTELIDRLRAGDTAGAAEARTRLVHGLDQASAAGVMTPERRRELVQQYTVLEPVMAGIQRGAGVSNGDAVGGAMALIFRAENPAGDARRTAASASDPTLTASGPGQITDGLWRTYAARLSLTPAQRNERGAHERIFRAYAADMGPALRRATGRDPDAGDYYVAWMLGAGAGPAMLAADPAANAREVYRASMPSGAEGDRNTAQAFRSNGALLRDGMTAGQVVDAVRARVGGERIRASRGEDFMAAAEALEAGPAHPGWRREFDAVPLAERRQMAEWARGQGRFQRAEAAHGLSEQFQALNLEGSRLLLEEAQGVAPERQAAIRARLIAISEVTGSPAARAYILGLEQEGRASRAQGRQEERERTVEVTNELALREGIARLQRTGAGAASGAAGENMSPGPNAITAQMQAVQGYPLAVQADVLNRTAARLEAAFTERQRLMRPMLDVRNALDTPGGARLENTADQQTAFRQMLGDVDLASPGAREALLRGARSNILLAELDGQMADALRARSPERVEGFAVLHQALMNDPAARQNYMATVPDHVRDAFQMVSQAIPSLPRDERRGAQFVPLMEQAADLLRADPKVMEARRASLGRDLPEQNRVIDEHLDTQIRRAGFLGFGTLPTRLPEEMREELRRSYVQSMGLASTPRDVANLALERVGRTWQPSVLGLPDVVGREDVSASGTVMRSATTTLRALSLFSPAGWALEALRPAGTPGRPRGVSDTTPDVQRRWVRNAPESHLAVHGRDILGNARTEPSAHWLVEDFPALARRLGVPEAEAADMRMGDNVMWRPVDRTHNGDQLYQLMRIRRGSDGGAVLDQVTRRLPDGTPSGVPLEFPLAAEARRLNALVDPATLLDAAFSRQERARRAGPAALRDSLVPPDPMGGVFRP